ncbi:MAG: hypothetical protein ACP5O3_01375 [Candidatus Micrarchaeia archaeon]|jgi:hypothetical protein
MDSENGSRKEFVELSAEFKKFHEDMKNPLVVGALLNKLAEERSSTNLLLREINAKLDRIVSLEERINALEKKLSGESTQPQNVLLPEIDEEIISFVRAQGKACAEEVQKHFNYKGRNGASARLNRLAATGLLQKTQVGKKVFFLAK